MYALLLIINNIFGSLIILNCLLLLLLPSGKLLPKLSHLFPLGTQASNSSLNMYLFLNSELQLGKSKEINNQGIKVQVKIAFKSYSFIFVTKMQKKQNKKETNKPNKQTNSAWNFLQPSRQMCRGVSLPYFNISTTIFYDPLLFENYLNPRGQDQQNDKQT